jgi:Cd2+/Zn2+-exporting ATPase
VEIVPPLLFGGEWLGESGWIYRALTMLVIACPCALVISTPVTVISAITAAARQGVLIKGGAYLEALGTVKAFAFDKTGTLTRGEPVVTQTQSMHCTSTDDCKECDDVLALAAAVERRSTHPLARAVVDAAQQRGIASAYAAADNVQTLAGRGVRGDVGGHHVTAGSHAYFDAEYPHETAVCALVDEAEANGQTTMLVGDERGVRGFVAVADLPRDEARDVVRSLQGMGGTVAMLTGDNPAVAHAVGAQIGVDDIRANLLPEDKVAAVEALREQYKSVAMIGDGINDTPALAAANVSVAMGGAGSAQALETANIALMADGLKQLPDAVRLARFARRLIVENVAISFGVKALFLVLAFFGGTSLWMAVLADMGISLLVTLNGMRPLRRKTG